MTALCIIGIVTLAHSGGHGHSSHSSHSSHYSHTNNYEISSRIVKTYITTALISDVVLVNNLYKYENYGRSEEKGVTYNVTHYYNFTTEDKLYRCLYYYKTINNINITIFLVDNNFKYIEKPLEKDEYNKYFCVYNYVNHNALLYNIINNLFLAFEHHPMLRLIF